MTAATVACIDGEFLPLAEARLSPMDRGFLFGDGVYEVIPVYGGYPFRLDAHLDRLHRSMDAIGIPSPHDRAGWQRLVGELIDRNGGGELSVYLQVTRGVAPERDPRFPDAPRPTVFGVANPRRPVDPTVLGDGAAVVTTGDIRWHRCDIKATTLLANVLARQAASEAGADEALFVNDRNEVTEGSASNVFAVRDGKLVTPPNGPSILPGITRDVILELARAEAMPVEERPLPLQDLRRAEEVWMTSSTRELLAVTRIDGERVGDGRPGPWWTRMDNLLQDYKRQWIDSQRRGDEPARYDTR